MKSKVFGLFVLVAMGAIAGAYLYLHSIPQLAYPLRSIDGWALADGGSITLEVVDADGQLVTLGITAVGLETSVNHYQAFIGRSVLGLPVPISAAAGSEREVGIMRLAQEIAGSGLGQGQLASVERGELDGLGKSEQRYVVAWTIYRELMERHEAQRKGQGE